MYNDSPEYWDSVANKEPTSRNGVPEKYTQAQCLTAFRLGLKQLPWDKTVISILKTDLWTEGVVRSREVLNHAVELAEDKGFYVDAYGMDISKEICERAVHLGVRANIRQGDIRCLPYLDRFFNIILDVSTIDHMPFSDAKIALGEYYRCLKPDGVLVLMFAHDSGRIDREGDPNKLVDYFPFRIMDVKRELEGDRYKIKGEYAVHFLNIYPMSRPMALGMKLGFAKAIAAVFGTFEFTPLSKILKKYAPMYVMIAVKR